MRDDLLGQSSARKPKKMESPRVLCRGIYLRAAMNKKTTSVMIVIASTILLFSSAASQGASSARLETPNDLAWARAFASPEKKDGDNKWDPHFRALMRGSFPQRQSFWRDHGKFPSVPELVEEFIGVPGGVSVDEDRYVTMDGCVPHACSARGMVWIDTRGSGKPLVIFVAPEDVSTANSEKRAPQHLWLYASDQLNWQKMPPEFVKSLARWYGAYQATWARYYRMNVLMLTLVEPNGLTYDLSPTLFALDSQTD